MCTTAEARFGFNACLELFKVDLNLLILHTVQRCFKTEDYLTIFNSRRYISVHHFVDDVNTKKQLFQI